MAAIIGGRISTANSYTDGMRTENTLTGCISATKTITGCIGAGKTILNDYVLSVDKIEGGHRLTITRGSEAQTIDIPDGVDGAGIAGIEKTASVGLTDEYTITLTDGSSYTFTVTNGDSGGSADVPVASETVAGIIRVGENLKISADGTLGVVTATNVEEDNTRPITAAAVYTEVGNINALLETI